FAHLQQGDHNRPLESFRDVLESGWFHDLDPEYRSWLLLLASSAVEAGDLERAARLFAAVSPAWGNDSFSFAGRFASDFQSYRAAAQERLGEEAWNRLWDEGQSMTLGEAVAYALKV